MAQDIVIVTLTGLRLATSKGDTATVAGAANGLENEFISSIQVGLVTGQAVDAALAHQNATAHQRSREARCCAFAAEAWWSKDLLSRHPIPPSSFSPQRRPLGTGLKFGRKFLRALPQRFVLDFPPCGAVSVWTFLNSLLELLSSRV